MKEKIIDIIGFGMEPERAELQAAQLMIIFNQHIIDGLKKCNSSDINELIDNIFIKIP
jgi:hypothetical protein